MKKLIEYLFPGLKPRDKLPLLPLDWSSDHSRVPMPDSEQLAEDILILQGYGTARTKADALRLIRRYPGKTVNEIVMLEKRQRRRIGKWRKAWQRLKRIW